ncbi:MAG: ribonuclease HI [Spirochaetia bacterium]
MKNTHIQIYTDGACSGNPGPGGWAALILRAEEEKLLCEGEAQTTNNRMELMAAIQALDAVQNYRGEPMRIYTDSQYVKNGISNWIENWKKNGWKNAKKEVVKNIDLWQKLDKLNADLRPQWEWVKGHDGNKYNEICDKAAVEMCKKYKNEVSAI